MDPITAFSEGPEHAPFQRGVRTDKQYFDWYAEPAQDIERHRFGVAMRGTTAMTANLVPQRKYDTAISHDLSLIYIIISV